ncbi:MAG: photosystem II stability/assembly factor-like uncharacterized protein [Sphingobacteriales bacterium]|jgi:photosystem II stability/assembly factor-like uncharacterized protein
MKYLTTLLLLLLGSSIYSQWNGRMWSGYITDNLEVASADTMYGGRDDGRMNFSYDGGRTWGQFFTPFIYSYIEDIDFVSNKIGYAVGGMSFGPHKTMLIRTKNAGESWEAISINELPGSFIKKVQFISEEVGFMASDLSNLFTTNNGGNSINIIPTPWPIEQMHFFNAQEGIVSVKESTSSGWRHSLHLTNDGGLNWKETYVDTVFNGSGNNDRYISDLQFLDNKVGFVVGYNGLFMKTTDGGETWDRRFIAPYSRLSSVSFVNEELGYINNVGGVWITKDGGMTWESQAMTPFAVVKNIHMVNENRGYLSANEGLLYTENGGASMGMNSVGKSLINLYPNPSKGEIFMELNDQVTEIRVLSTAGKEVLSFNGFQKSLDLGHLPKGLYFIHVVSNASTEVRQVVLE